MQTLTAKFRTLEFGEAKTYLVALLFVLGNIALPQLCHTLRMGGPTWLPIYFFTLVAAYKYGWRAGLLTAILLKSAVLALVAGWTAARFRRVSLLLLAGVVLVYQTIGTLGEWALAGDLSTAMQDFRLGIPGMLLQIFGGRAIIGVMNRNRYAR
ncbi:ECF transporter S component [uncultured Alistipes sp.]|uniref:ECF transporter S component n=1 Tax=uncultured Alistipes sp. TaxID=538949 RepID=UPI00272C7965|nr:ECF transporter S component [uncultured Alistipes sp.]